MARRSAAARAAALSAPDSPFAPLIGAGRKAAHRRTLLRRLTAVLLGVCAVAILLVDPGRDDTPAAPAGGSAGGTAPGASAGSPGDGGGLLPDLPGPPSTGGDGSGASADPRRPGPGDTLGAGSIPVGYLGVAVEIDPLLGRRLVTGDIVDLYARGSAKAVARGAIVIDVTRPEDADLSADPAQAGGGPQDAAASVFLAVSEGDARRIPAVQRRDAPAATYFVSVQPRQVTDTQRTE